MNEQEFFNSAVRLLSQQQALKLDLKALMDNGKEAELDVKTLKAAAALYVSNLFEERSAEFQRIKQAYESLAD